jgi:hypothetical protein
MEATAPIVVLKTNPMMSETGQMLSAADQEALKLNLLLTLD